MATEDQPGQGKQHKERLLTRTNWIVCSLIALLLTIGNIRNYQGGGLAYLLGGFIGSLIVVVLFWITARGIFRWITKKRNVA